MIIKEAKRQSLFELTFAGKGSFDEDISVDPHWLLDHVKVKVIGYPIRRIKEE